MGMLSESPNLSENPADFLAEWSYAGVIRRDIPTGGRG
jgi:hypothetical protein